MIKKYFNLTIILIILLITVNLSAQIQNPRNVEYNFKTDTTKTI